MAPKQAPELPARWSVDRHIPVATIISIAMFCIVQTVTIVVWGATLTSRVSTLEEQVKSQAAIIGPVVERSIRVETRIEALLEGQVRVEHILRNSSILTYIPGGQGTIADPRPTKPALTR